ncbi:glycosyl transferase [Blastococcus sp. Marseille-P5729]|uniref:rhamnosyltransferase WsaF family glycosyltransferase n=1 Tax=Blastococcus sp. Marseille-P5729 TaxID=2086582 RepID=UPI000D0F5872|nr:glycosyl transferase [Blastococcus sp. Marseille-P5729]
MVSVNRLQTMWRTGRRVYREDGALAAAALVVEKTPFLRRGLRQASLLVSIEEARSVDWTTSPHFADAPPVPSGTTLNTAWIMSPPGKSSGGHQNIVRFISFLEAAGHTARIYLRSERPKPSELERVRELLAMSSSYSRTVASVEYYDPARGVDGDTHAIFATGWETAYAAYLDRSRARRFYFVQDFEPMFYPVGSDYLLAENTYRFGFHGITAGRWLAQKLRDDFGMETDYFDFAADQRHYSLTNTGRRDAIFFYARPVTARRAFEFGVAVLAEFAAMRPDVQINLAGWDVSTYDLPFEYVNHSDLDIEQLNEVYNQCAAGLVLSLTNMSLLPLELMAAGVVPVVNAGDNNAMVTDNPHIHYVDASPRAIARELVSLVEREDSAQHAKTISESVNGLNWQHSGTQFVRALERAMYE